MMYVLDRFVNRTRLGRGIRAVAQNPDSAALMGVNKNRVISLVFLLGGLMAGIAAVMYDLKIGNAKYDDGFAARHRRRSPRRCSAASATCGAPWSAVSSWALSRTAAVPCSGRQYHDAVVAFVVLILILMFRPTGLLGESLGRARA